MTFNPRTGYITNQMYTKRREFHNHYVADPRLDNSFVSKSRLESTANNTYFCRASQGSQGGHGEGEGEEEGEGGRFKFKLVAQPANPLRDGVMLGLNENGNGSYSWAEGLATNSFFDAYGQLEWNRRSGFRSHARTHANFPQITSTTPSTAPTAPTAPTYHLLTTYSPPIAKAIATAIAGANMQTTRRSTRPARGVDLRRRLQQRHSHPRQSPKRRLPIRPRPP